MLRGVIGSMLILFASGCAIRQPVGCPAADVVCRGQLDEIARLQRELAESRAQVERLRARQKDQVKELEETVSEAARAEVKLRRFATEADVASRLAEVEVAMGELRARGRDFPLQHAAQGLLDAATAAFRAGELNAAAERAAQSEQLVDMLVRYDSGADSKPAAEVAFTIAIPLRTNTDANLRRDPRRGGALVGVLPKGAPVTVLGYHGLWMRVNTGDDRSGWVSGELLEVR